MQQQNLANVACDGEKKWVDHTAWNVASDEKFGNNKLNFRTVKTVGFQDVALQVSKTDGNRLAGSLG